MAAIVRVQVGPIKDSRWFQLSEAQSVTIFFFFNWAWWYFTRVVLISHARLLSTCPKPVWLWKSELNGLGRSVPCQPTLCWCKEPLRPALALLERRAGPSEVRDCLHLSLRRSHSLAFTCSCLTPPQTNYLSSREGRFFPQTICRQTNAATREDCNAFRTPSSEKLPKIWRLC